MQPKDSAIAGSMNEAPLDRMLHLLRSYGDLRSRVYDRVSERESSQMAGSRLSLSQIVRCAR